MEMCTFYCRCNNCMLCTEVFGQLDKALLKDEDKYLQILWRTIVSSLAFFYMIFFLFTVLHLLQPLSNISERNSIKKGMARGNYLRHTTACLELFLDQSIGHDGSWISVEYCWICTQWRTRIYKVYGIGLCHSWYWVLRRYHHCRRSSLAAVRQEISIYCSTNSVNLVCVLNMQPCIESSKGTTLKMNIPSNYFRCLAFLVTIIKKSPHTYTEP